MHASRRRRAVVLAAVLYLVLLFSVGFLAAEANHSHPDNAPCPVCARMETQVHLWQTLTAAAVGIGGFVFLLFRRQPETLRLPHNLPKPTLVKLRVLLLR